jgi:hypothetical protein
MHSMSENDAIRCSIDAVDLFAHLWLTLNNRRTSLFNGISFGSVARATRDAGVPSAVHIVSISLMRKMSNLVRQSRAMIDK